MDLSIIILNYKTKGLLKQLLRRLLKEVRPSRIKVKGSDLPAGSSQPLADSYQQGQGSDPSSKFKKVGPLQKNFEIIVVDNASNDSSVDLIKKEFAQVKLIESKTNCGYAAGNNLGIKAAKSKYILILNPDVMASQDSIAKLYQFLESHPEAGMVGPKLINPDGSIQYSCCQLPAWYVPILRRTFLGKLPFARKKLRNYLMMDWDHRKSREVDWLFGACLIVRRQAMEKVGLMDERFFLYFEDIDWCRRFWQVNWKVYYLPEAEMVHLHQRLSAESPGFRGVFSQAGRTHIASWFKYLWKWRKRFDRRDLPHRRHISEEVGPHPYSYISYR